jgi:hypothetical protein
VGGTSGLRRHAAGGGGHLGRRDRLRGDPASGAGFLDTSLALCLYARGVPLAAAIAGVFSYRFLSLFATMPLCFAALPELRAIGGRQTTPSREPAVQPQAETSSGSG